MFYGVSAIALILQAAPAAELSRIPPPDDDCQATECPVSVASIPPAKPEDRPCDKSISCLSDPDARRLQVAWDSKATTDGQRARMASIIRAHSSGSTIDWKASADKYFTWRQSESSVILPKPLTSEERAEAKKREAVFQAKMWEGFRSAGERAIRAQLIDPSSAEFQWPYEFAEGYWKPFLRRRIEGVWTCGRVNSRNRMGGFAGNAAFVIVFTPNGWGGGEVSFIDIDDSDSDLIASSCNKALDDGILKPRLETEGDGNMTPPQGPARFSIADEIMKLADLRDRGLISDEEFETQKKRLLAE